MIISDGLLLLILFFLVVIKTIHFVKNIRHKKLLYWFYFSRYNIILSSTPESAQAKKKQNAYTISIGVMLLAIFFTVYLQVLLMM